MASFGDMLKGARQGTERRRSDRQSEIDDLPKVSRSFSSVRDQDCASGYSGKLCDVEILEGDEAAFVDDEIACQACFTAAQETRDDFFDR
jgi:hypothetical protein